MTGCFKQYFWVMTGELNKQRSVLLTSVEVLFSQLRINDEMVCKYHRGVTQLSPVFARQHTEWQLPEVDHWCLNVLWRADTLIELSGIIDVLRLGEPEIPRLFYVYEMLIFLIRSGLLIFNYFNKILIVQLLLS